MSTTTTPEIRAYLDEQCPDHGCARWLCFADHDHTPTVRKLRLQGVDHWKLEQEHEEAEQRLADAVNMFARKHVDQLLRVVDDARGMPVALPTEHDPDEPRLP